MCAVISKYLGALPFFRQSSWRVARIFPRCTRLQRTLLEATRDSSPINVRADMMYRQFIVQVRRRLSAMRT